MLESKGFPLEPLLQVRIAGDILGQRFDGARSRLALGRK